MKHRMWLDSLSPHETEQLQRTGLIKPVLSNDTIDEAIRWFSMTLEARDIDYMTGTIKKLTWDDVLSLVTYEPTWIPTRDLASYCFSIDTIYIEQARKYRDEASA